MGGGWLSGDVKKERVDNVLIMTRSLVEEVVKTSRFAMAISDMSQFPLSIRRPSELLRDLDCVIVANAFTPTVASSLPTRYFGGMSLLLDFIFVRRMKEGKRFKFPSIFLELRGAR